MTSVDIIAVPYDSGRRGYRMGAGPDHLLAAGLADLLRASGHETTTYFVCDVGSDALAASPLASAAALMSGVSERVAAACSAGRFPIVLSGNCISTVGALAGLSPMRPGVAWFDAHADLNTPNTSTSGFLDGMSAAIALGRCHGDAAARVPGYRPLEPTHLVLIGARDIEPAERIVMDEAPIRNFGAHAVPDASSIFATHVDDIYVHVDLDVLDAMRVSRANTYAVEGGLDTSHTISWISRLSDAGVIRGLTVSAYDPAADTDSAVQRAALEIITTIVERT